MENLTNASNSTRVITRVVNNVGSTRIKYSVVTTSLYMNIELSNHYSKSTNINRKLFHKILKLEFVSTYNYEARRGH